MIDPRDQAQRDAREAALAAAHARELQQAADAAEREAEARARQSAASTAGWEAEQRRRWTNARHELNRLIGQVKAVLVESPPELYRPTPELVACARKYLLSHQAERDAEPDFMRRLVMLDDRLGELDGCQHEVQRAVVRAGLDGIDDEEVASALHSLETACERAARARASLLAGWAV